MVVSITRLRIRAWRLVPAFLVLAVRSARLAKAARGNVAVAVLAEKAADLLDANSLG